MNRREFMEQLERLLEDIPQEERIEALAYYHGYFEDAGIENEESIIKELESPEKVARMIKADMGMEEEKEYTETGYEDTRFRQQEEVGEPVKQHGNNKKETYEKSTGRTSYTKEDKTSKIILIVILAILTSPLWLGVLGTLVGLIFGAFGIVLGIVLAVTFTVLAFYIAGFVMCGVGISMFTVGAFATGIGVSGTGFLLLAIAVLGTIACVWLFGRFLPWLVKGTVSLCSRLFQGRGSVA